MKKLHLIVTGLFMMCLMFTGVSYGQTRGASMAAGEAKEQIHQIKSYLTENLKLSQDQLNMLEKSNQNVINTLSEIDNSEEDAKVKAEKIKALATQRENEMNTIFTDEAQRDMFDTHMKQYAKELKEKNKEGGIHLPDIGKDLIDDHGNITAEAVNLVLGL
ncbi:hypothetical protein V6R21_17365 [Limibacter armeniacum]|uniref:hypothetical protein n=1 Tax=Limibacter armeniacum TaxID=466084 RepID=UPI002FE63EED